MGERRPGNGHTADDRNAPGKTENDGHIICFKELRITALGFHDKPRFDVVVRLMSHWSAAAEAQLPTAPSLLPSPDKQDTCVNV